MGVALQRLHRRKKALRQLKDLWKRQDHVLIVHYSCESLYGQPEGGTGRINAIAVRNYTTTTTKSFAIHIIAQIHDVSPEKIPDQYNALEKEMLSEFYDFMKAHKTFDWVHWNMRNIVYGFDAIEQRFRVLHGHPEVLEESRKFDLPTALEALFGTHFIEHPRLENIIQKNHINNVNFLDGEKEAEEFQKKQYAKVHQSTLRKVAVLARILGKTFDGSLKTNARWHEIYGVHPKAWIEYISEHWVIALLGLVVTLAGFVTLIISFF